MRIKKPISRPNVEISHAAYQNNRDPAGIVGRKGRTPLEGDATVKKELTFNTYLSQLEEPRSFLNLLPEIMKKTVVSIPQKLIDADEDDLLRILKEEYNYIPSSATEALRTNFWMEHDRVATTRNEIINQGNIYLGVVSRQYFIRIIEEAPHIIAYILCRPPEYEAVMRGLLNLSTRKIRDVLNIPLQKADGSIQDAKIIELVLKAAAMVDLRAKGGYIQRSETKNLTLMKQEQTSYTTVFNAASSTKPTDLTALTADIDQKIAALEKEMAAVPGISHQSSGPTASSEVIAADYRVVDKGEDIV